MFSKNRINPTILEVNLSALVSNFNYFRSILNPSTRIICVVKANAYGMGAYRLSKTLQNNGVSALAVAYIGEGIFLREKGIYLPIFVMNVEKYSLHEIFKYNLSPCIYDKNILDLIIIEARKQNILNYPIHLKIDTGMHRLGFCSECIPSLINILKNQNNVFVQSVFSHLAATNNPIFDDFTNKQIKLFICLSKQLEQSLQYSFQRHILNSVGIERFPNAQFDMVRLGIGLYGIYTTTLCKKIAEKTKYSIKPVAVLKARILQIKKLKKGETVGYNCNGVLNRNSYIACISIGYADGLNRRFSNQCGSVFIHGHSCHIIGDICMDTCMVDITDIKNIEVMEGDEVEIFGENIMIESLAKKLQTVPYEVLTSVSNTVKRVYVEN
ncbi:MAG: alanine racemase [Bacteroidales bacterium OttesenSCG-928-I14]|jgi:alanine racemase|nr:alanine racemase [Bacteroidales bacterium OttesenSCG-928-I14]